MAKTVEFEMSDYDGGLRSQPIHSKRGKLVLAGDEWQLHFDDVKGEKWRSHEWAHGPIMGWTWWVGDAPKGCRVVMTGQDRGMQASFSLPKTPATTLREEMAKRQGSIDEVRPDLTARSEFRMNDYDGGLRSQPKPSNSGRLLLTDGWTLHFDDVAGQTGGTHMLVRGAIGKCTWWVGDLPSGGCQVVMTTPDRNEQGSFTLPEAPSSTLREKLVALQATMDEARPQMVQPAAQPAPARLGAPVAAPAQPDAPWWSGITPSTWTTNLYPVFRSPGGDKLTLKVTEDGVEWGQLGSHVRVPWGAIADISSEIVRAQHGRQRGAIGVGPIGLAVVGATALHNRRAARVDEYTRFTFTDKAGQSHQFLTQESQGKINNTLGPTIRAFLAHAKRLADAKAAEVAKARQAQAEAAKAAEEAKTRAITEAAVAAAKASSPVSLADELAKLVALKEQGVLSEEEFAAAKARLLTA
jgi:Short C-terminal domain